MSHDIITSHLLSGFLFFFSIRVRDGINSHYASVYWWSAALVFSGFIINASLISKARLVQIPSGIVIFSRPDVSISKLQLPSAFLGQISSKKKKIKITESRLHTFLNQLCYDTTRTTHQYFYRKRENMRNIVREALYLDAPW